METIGGQAVTLLLLLLIGWVTLSGKGVSRRYLRRQGLCLRLHPVNVIITSVLSGATAS
jgi:hypothetical protein